MKAENRQAKEIERFDYRYETGNNIEKEKIKMQLLKSKRVGMDCFQCAKFRWNVRKPDKAACYGKRGGSCLFFLPKEP